jgi:hypothetical protein
MGAQASLMPFQPDRASDVEVINSWSDGDITLAARRGTLKSGAQRKARYSIEIRSEPLLLDLNELVLGGKLAEVWAQRIRDNIQGIAVPASKATQAFREGAVGALQRGEAWARQRYAGGRIGAMAPNTSDKLFSDSGRLAAGVHVRQNLTDASYTVNFPANRFNRETFGANYDAMVAKFVSLVPMLDPKKAIGDPAIEKAIKQSLEDSIQKLESNAQAAIVAGLARLRAQQLRVLKQIGAIVARAVGL